MAFPLPALPGLISTTPLSDSLQGIDWSLLYYHLFQPYSSHKRHCRVSRVPVYSQYPACHRLRPRGAVQHLPDALHCVGFRTPNCVAHPILALSRLNPFNYRLRPTVLVPLCLTFGVTPAGPGFSIRWLVCLAGAGLPPDGINDLARPH